MDESKHVLMVVCYVGCALWRNGSMHTMAQSGSSSQADKEQGHRSLDIESCLRTCAQIPNVYVLGLFDSCRQELDSEKESTQNKFRTSKQANLVTIYRGEPT